MRKVDTCDDGADVLLDLRNLHSLGGNHRRGSAHDLAPHILARRLRRVRAAFRKATLANSDRPKIRIYQVLPANHAAPGDRAE
jgi:hypothetical protein